ncbi:MAG: hypothetical protein ACLS30_01700 [Oscillospiraceae bacterium]
MRKKKITQISAIAMAMAMAVTPTANVFAYGETSGNSTLFSDTQKVSDYSTWKDSVWNKKIQKELLQEKVKLTIHQK